MNFHGSVVEGEIASNVRPPHNLEAEFALLGALLINNDVLERVAPIIGPEHFHEILHGDLFKLIAETISAGRRADPITLKTRVESWPPVSDKVTVPQYLGDLCASATSIVNAPDYARTIVELSTRRALMLIGEDVHQQASDDSLNIKPDELVEDAHARLDGLRRLGVNERQTVALDAGMQAAIDLASEAYERGDGLAGISTGINSLDAMLGGLRPGHLVILAGRPSMGKTSLGTNIAQNIVMAKNPLPVGFFSLEMEAKAIAARVLARLTGIPSWRQERGKLTEADFCSLMEAKQRYGKAPLHTDHSSNLTILQLISRARSMRRKHDVAVLVVDYLQLIGGTTYRGNNRAAEVAEISKALKGLAKELDVPIVVLSQLSRKNEDRDDKRPHLSDLRDSGSIEQDADAVMFVFREQYYVARREPDETDLAKHSKWQGELAACAGKAEVILGKHRHGPVGTVTLGFDAELTTFSDLGGERAPAASYPTKRGS